MNIKFKRLVVCISTIMAFFVMSSAWSYINMRDCTCENASDCGPIMELNQEYECSKGQISDPNGSGNSTINIDGLSTSYLYAYCYPPDNVEGLPINQYYSNLNSAAVDVPDSFVSCWPDQGFGPDTAGVTYKKIICRNSNVMSRDVQIVSIKCQIFSR